MELVFMLIAMFAIFYFLLVRPQKKRQQQHQSTVDALQPGQRVILTSGYFATISHMGERQAIVELAPGVEVTVLKGNIARPAEADEEEFEFADDSESIAFEEPVTTEETPDQTFDPRPDNN